VLAAVAESDGQEAQTRAAGYDHHLVRPMSPEALAAVLAATLAARAR
jgi:CheY-like chemotaxis protein